MEKTILNTSPALTWNWLKMNRAFLTAETNDNIITQKKQIIATKNEQSEYLHFDFEDGKNYLCEQSITAKENSCITVIIDYTSLPTAKGLCTIKTNLIAEKYSNIHLIKVQLLGQNYIQIDETTGNCDENAQIKITQIELGGSKIYASIKNNLNGYNSKFKSETAYHCKGEQQFDFNYISNHIGPKTDTKIIAKGVVDDCSLKTYRGTINFKNGCKESTGDEQEETLLMSAQAVNKSLPIILCDEEDVSGTHGATLGRLSEEELFYMQSRGINETEAKKMMAKAKIVSVAQKIPHQPLIDSILKFIDE